MATELDLFTTSYPRFTPDMGVPVRSSNGTPKYRLGYELVHIASRLIPPWKLVRSPVSDAEFDVLYARELDRRGMAEVRGELERIARSAGDSRLVVMCFEKNPRQCHRRAFARWWEDRTGQEVPELPLPQASAGSGVSETEEAGGYVNLELFPPVAQRIERGLS